jgi:hypothetical protein
LTGSYFTGRDDDVRKIVELLRPNEIRLAPVVIMAAVEEQGGVGKTTLAIAAAHALKADYPEAQLFFELRAHSPNPVRGVDARNS